MVFYSILLFYNDFETLLSGFQYIDWKIFPLILILSVCLQLIAGVRYHIFIRELGVKINLKDSIFISLAGQSMLGTPGRVGTLIKSYIIKKKFNNSHSSTIPAIIMEQAMELIVATVLLAIILIWIYSIETQIIVTISLILLTVFFSMIKNPYVFRLLKKIFKFKIFEKYLTNFEESNQSLKKLLSIKVLTKGLLISTISKLVQVFMIFITLDMIGLNISFIESGLIYNTSLLIGVFSLVPAGIVVTDASLLSLILRFDDNFVLASVGVILIRFVTLWFNVLIGFIVLKTKFKFFSLRS